MALGENFATSSFTGSRNFVSILSLTLPCLYSLNFEAHSSATYNFKFGRILQLGRGGNYKDFQPLLRKCAQKKISAFPLEKCLKFLSVRLYFYLGWTGRQPVISIPEVGGNCYFIGQRDEFHAISGLHFNDMLVV